ncbi:helix-turn-helix transcriptional regulator [Cryobacterium sp. GrIS_2_6]|uniref:helix-turn-helix domain-containing protein n=1 Tax=Cryobacterium sp. GrIS_2_6 TaxID=3162785 RepID=UPI002DFB29FD|nr:DNA-binding Xre family transcriptional regulator [Cryobacterium psychrotolerans]MEC5149284.1 DNA-binding Xre family transcriptional regulator [Cryobacterium psychrotolerans]MEC5149363.1 DNA-binding Xre family transcriptional regulator [Cryobacterium psychrotolerans]
MGRDNITKTALAAAVGISRPQMQKILAGEKQIDIEQIDAICWALGLKTRAVIAEADAASSSRNAEPDRGIAPL